MGSSLHREPHEAGMSAPVVSVVVPAWNAEATLAETLASVAAQRFADLEILIVDDGSVDATATVARDFCASDPRGRLIGQANGGVASARNAGIAAARGEWIAPIDADDLWHPDYLFLLMEKARGADPLPVMVYAHCRVIDERGRLITTGFDPDVAGMAFLRMAYCNPVGNGSGMMFRRASVVGDGPAGGGYDARLHAAGRQGYEDWLLQVRLAATGPVARVGAYLVGYRRRPGSMSDNLARMVASEAMARATLARELGDPPFPGWLRRWIRANQCVLRAAVHLRHRRWLAVLGHLGLAAMLDPLRVSAVVAGQLGRRMRRRSAGHEEHTRLTFAEASTAIGEHAPTRTEWRWRQQEARLRRIARYEANPQRPSTSGGDVGRPCAGQAAEGGRMPRP